MTPNSPTSTPSPPTLLLALPLTLPVRTAKLPSLFSGPSQFSHCSSQSPNPSHPTSPNCSYCSPRPLPVLPASCRQTPSVVVPSSHHSCRPLSNSTIVWFYSRWRWKRRCPSSGEPTTTTGRSTGRASPTTSSWCSLTCWCRRVTMPRAPPSWLLPRTASGSKRQWAHFKKLCNRRCWSGEERLQLQSHVPTHRKTLLDILNWNLLGVSLLLRSSCIYFFYSDCCKIVDDLPHFSDNVICNLIYLDLYIFNT